MSMIKIICLKIFLILFFIMYNITSIHAEIFKDSNFKKNDSIRIKKKPIFYLHSEFSNNQFFNGRYDSIKLQYQTFTLGFDNQKGFTFEVTADYFIKGDIIDNYEILASYSRYLTENFSIGASGTKYFFHTNSKNIKNSIQGFLELSFNYDFSFMSIGLISDYYIGSENDFSLGLNFSKSVEFGNEKNKYFWEPSFSINASTLNYFTEYVNNKIIKAETGFGHKKNRYITTTNFQGIDILDFELGSKFTVSCNNKVDIFFDPIFIVPINPIKTITTIENIKTNQIEATVTSTPISERNLKDYFYFGFGFIYRF